jgi:hypothetical protein
MTGLNKISDSKPRKHSMFLVINADYSQIATAGFNGEAIRVMVGVCENPVYWTYAFTAPAKREKKKTAPVALPTCLKGTVPPKK